MDASSQRILGFHDPGNPWVSHTLPTSSSRLNHHTARRVNLGGLFILERMTSPAIFERYPDTVDEWDLSIAMASDLSNGGLGQIEEHYRTFIVSVTQ